MLKFDIMETQVQNTKEGEDNLKREFSKEELMEGITVVTSKTGFVTKFNDIVIPKDNKEFQDAVELVLAKNDALIEKIKNMPKISDIEKKAR